MFQNGLIGLQLGGGSLGAPIGRGGGKRRSQPRPFEGGGMQSPFMPQPRPFEGGGMQGGAFMPRPFEGGGMQGGAPPHPFGGGGMQGQSVNQGGMQNGLLSMFGGQGGFGLQNPFWGQMRQY